MLRKMKPIVKIYIKTLTNKNYSQRGFSYVICFINNYIVNCKTNINYKL